MMIHEHASGGDVAKTEIGGLRAEIVFFAVAAPEAFVEAADPLEHLAPHQHAEAVRGRNVDDRICVALVRDLRKPAPRHVGEFAAYQ